APALCSALRTRCPALSTPRPPLEIEGQSIASAEHRKIKLIVETPRGGVSLANNHVPPLTPFSPHTSKPASDIFTPPCLLSVTELPPTFVQQGADDDWSNSSPELPPRLRVLARATDPVAVLKGLGEP